MRSLKLRRIAILVIIGLVMLSGMPVFVSEDANHDRKIDIRDAVITLQMADHKEFPNTARGREKSIAVCENTLKTVAGLKEIVPQTFETEKSFSSHFCFLMSCVDMNPIFLNYDMIIEHSASFSSVISPPFYQPPIFS